MTNNSGEATAVDLPRCRLVFATAALLYPPADGGGKGGRCDPWGLTSPSPVDQFSPIGDSPNSSVTTAQPLPLVVTGAPPPPMNLKGLSCMGGPRYDRTAAGSSTAVGDFLSLGMSMRGVGLTLPQLRSLIRSLELQTQVLPQ